MKDVTRKILLVLLLLVVVIGIMGCAGHEPYPIATHQRGDNNRSCESLRLQISQNEVMIKRKLAKDESKFWTNLFWFIWFTPAMDMKHAEKVEAEALQARNNYLEILMNEKNCK